MNQAAAVALSAIIQGLAEMDMVAITRRIYNRNSNPVMGALFPDITKDYEVSRELWNKIYFTQCNKFQKLPKYHCVAIKFNVHVQYKSIS